MFRLSFGGIFFAIPFVGLSISPIVSALVGAGAFGATELLLSDKKKENTIDEKPIDLNIIFIKALKQCDEIIEIINKIEDTSIQNDLLEISNTAKKIITATRNKKGMYKKYENFFDYYLPYTLKLANKYDEIENQNLRSQDSIRFMESSKATFSKINEVFKNLLDNMYQSDIDSATAEQKVFEMMANSDGLSFSGFDNYNKGDKQ